jgi:hypothetical protein
MRLGGDWRPPPGWAAAVDEPARPATPVLGRPAGYANQRAATYGLVDAHCARMGSDGTVWLDGKPDDGRPLRPRCPVPSCGQTLTDYPGHLCLQPDGSEVWKDWP